MERLTKISKIGNAYYPKCFEEPCCGMRECLDDRCSLMLDACKKLAEYEQLEEQGLLVRLPCKVGDTVYVPTRVLVSEFKITAIFCDIHGTYFYWLFYCGIYERTSGFSERDIGKTVFLTREEAEKKLEEMKNAQTSMD